MWWRCVCGAVARVVNRRRLRLCVALSPHVERCIVGCTHYTYHAARATHANGHARVFVPTLSHELVGVCGRGVSEVVDIVDIVDTATTSPTPPTTTTATTRLCLYFYYYYEEEEAGDA